MRCRSHPEPPVWRRGRDRSKARRTWPGHGFLGSEALDTLRFSRVLPSNRKRMPRAPAGSGTVLDDGLTATARRCSVGLTMKRHAGLAAVLLALAIHAAGAMQVDDNGVPLRAIVDKG